MIKDVRKTDYVILALILLAAYLHHLDMESLRISHSIKVKCMDDSIRQDTAGDLKLSLSTYCDYVVSGKLK